MESINTEMYLFCPRRSCPFFEAKTNPITKMGTYPVPSESARRQLYWCEGGGHKFSETQFSDLWHKHGSFKEYEQTAKLIKYGLSPPQIADVLLKEERSIEAWIQAIGRKSFQFHNWICLTIGLLFHFLQFDELWSYVSNKSNQYWVFTAFEVSTRFWIGVETGKRTTATAKKIVRRVYEMGTWSRRRLVRITTDKLAAYTNAIQTYFDGKARYVYLQIVKVRIKRRLKTVKKAWIRGTEKDFPEGTQNTSYIERHNLTLRQRISYLKRKTLGYCKEPEAMKRALWINLFDYNYSHPHKSLRRRLPGRKKQKFKKQYRSSTPAMKMGLTNQPLNWRMLFLAPVPSG